MSGSYFTDNSDFAPSVNKSGNRKPNKWLDDELESYNPAGTLEEQKQSSAFRQLEGTKRALASLNESETIGYKTAEELVSQGEQLHNAENNIDKINKNTAKSQKSINSIKSVFGGISAWWNGEGKKDIVNEPPKEFPKSNLSNFVETSDETCGPIVYQRESTSVNQNQQNNYNKQLNSDLSDMSDGMSRLRGLALGLGDEIQRQNDQIDRIHDKADKTNVDLQRQNKEMSRILKK